MILDDDGNAWSPGQEKDPETAALLYVSWLISVYWGTPNWVKPASEPFVNRQLQALLHTQGHRTDGPDSRPRDDIGEPNRTTS